MSNSKKKRAAFGTNECQVCGKRIRVQIRRGSGLCGGKCAKKAGKL